MSALEGVRVLVTRPRERAQELCFLLEDLGAEVVSLPVLELAPPDDPRPLRAAAERIDRYAWVAFASPAAVSALVEAVREAGAAERLPRVHVAVVGPRTAAAAKSHGLTPELEAGAATGAGLAESLLEKLQAGEQVLLPAAQDGRRELEEGLRARGVEVTRVAAYRADSAALPPEVLADVRQRPPRAMLFASPRSAEALLDALGDGGRPLLEAARLVAIGPTTAAALEALGFQVAAVAKVPTPAGLAEATAAAFGA